MSVFVRFYLIFLLSVCSADAANAGVDTIEGPQISLAGKAKFSDGFDRRWAEPNFDDSAWQTVTLPHLWTGEDAAWHESNGAYRIRFRAPRETEFEMPAIIGLFFKEHEIYLNGVRVGGTPYFGLRGREPTTIDTFSSFAVYPIPTQLLDRSGENTLTIYVSRLALGDAGGIGREPLAIVEYHQARSALLSVKPTHWMLDGFLTGMNLLLVMLAFGAWAFGVRERVVITFALLIGSYLVLTIFGTHAFHDLGLDTPLFEGVVVLMLAADIILLIEFIAALLNRHVGKIGRTLQFCSLLGLANFASINLFSITVPLAWADFVQISQIVPFAAGFFGGMVWMLGICIAAIRQGNVMGWLLFVALGSVYLLPALAWSLWQQDLSNLTFRIGYPPLNIMQQLFFLMLAGLVGVRLSQMERERREARDFAVRAQSDERQRVARDMHDGLGQWLNAIKIRLQLLYRDTKDQTPDRAKFTELIDDMDALINDTTRIARDLSSSSIERRGLAGALKDHATMLGDDHGVEVNLDTELSGPVPLDISDHLYRVVQEASSNALRHGEATEISISLKTQKSAGGTLIIRDNGLGFDMDRSNAHEGLGLQSIIERAAMINGRADVSSSPGNGTTIRITF